MREGWTPEERREYLSVDAEMGDAALEEFLSVREILDDLEREAVDALMIPGEDLHRGAARIWAVRALRRELLQRHARGQDAKGRLLEE